jgi:hypothetical protein
MFMKKVILFCMLLFSVLSLKAQEPLSFEKVITVDSVGKDVIFSKVSEWIASAFISTDGDYYTNRVDGIITKDYSIAYKYGSFIYAAYDGEIRCKIKVAVKDGKFKVVLFNFVHKAIERRGQLEDFSMYMITTAEKSGKKGINKSGHDKAWTNIKARCEAKANDIFADFEKLKFKSDNW